MVPTPPPLDELRTSIGSPLGNNLRVVGDLGGSLLDLGAQWGRANLQFAPVARQLANFGRLGIRRVGPEKNADSVPHQIDHLVSRDLH